jgi:predicted glycoside hydrolase/deacetylase ChbG (UPF0249 family)
MGILKAHETGIVSAVSVVSVGSYFKKGWAALKRSGVDVGIHLAFVDREKALAGPIRGLTDYNGLFLKNKIHVIPRIALKTYDRKALEKELYTQVYCLADTGISITHINSHQHLHLLPGMTQIVVEIAKYFNIPWVRIPQSNIWNVKGCGLNMLGHRLRRISARFGLRFTDHCMGFDNSGHIDQTIFTQLLDKVKPGITELIMHPGLDASHMYGWGFDWQKELNALTSSTTLQHIKRLDIQLTNYSSIT